MRKYDNHMQKGYMTLITVLIISAAVLIIGTTVSLLAVGQAQQGLSVTRGEQTLAFVEGCMEDALLKTKNSPTYAGGTITRPEGTCSITVSKAGNTWTLYATTTATTYRRIVRVVVVRSTNTLVLSSWEEQ
jgi:hypothetical protein